MADETNVQPDIIANKAPSVFPYSSEAVSTTVSASSQEDQLNRNKKPNRQSYKSQPSVDGKGSKSAGSLTDDAGGNDNGDEKKRKDKKKQNKDAEDNNDNKQTNNTPKCAQKLTPILAVIIGYFDINSVELMDNT